MAQPGDDVAKQLEQLDAARKLALGDVAFYPQITTGILQILGAHARLELRRWGADFLAEAFSSPVFPAAQKQQLAPGVLQTIQETLLLPETDPAVLQSLVQTAASLYPLVFRHIVNHPEDSQSWEKMNAIKLDILRRMETFPCPVKICCVKFIQRIVQVQTPGLIADPRRPDQNETSLAVVPRTHAVLSIPNLEAEASGLLDRLLGVFQEENCDVLMVNATLSCLAPLIRTRQSIASKIISAVLDFFPAKHVSPPFTPTVRVSVKSMERTARALMINVIKRNPSNSNLGERIQTYLGRLAQSRLEVTEDASRKRGLPAEPMDAIDNAKRARLDTMTPPTLQIPPMAPGPASFDKLFTLTQDAGLSSFDVKQLPADLVVKIAVPLLAQVNPSVLTQAIDAVRNRYETITKEQNLARQQQAQPAAAATGDDDDDYEPEYQPMDAADDGNEETTAAAEIPDIQPELVSLGPFVLPKPPPMTEEEAGEVGRSAVARVFSMIQATESDPTPKNKNQQQLGFARLAGSNFDRDAWVLLLTRLATRAPAGLEGGDKSGQGGRRQPTISDSIRETLYRYILEDFRARLNIGITWLNEEWYNDRIQMTAAASQRDDGDKNEINVIAHYDTWVLRLLDGILPYIDSRDIKIIVRFLSEIPEVTVDILQRVASLAKDPERVNLCVQSLMYLIMFRPPAREMSLNTLEDIHQTYEEARPAAGKVLAKWRPQQKPTEAAANGAASSEAPTPQPEAQPSAAPAVAAAE